MAYQLSDRMKKLIEAYDIDGDVAVTELQHAAKLPAYAWLPEEFEQAVRAGAFTPETWGICYNDGLDPEDTDLVDHDVRLFWQAIHPDKPYPHDASDANQAP